MPLSPTRTRRKPRDEATVLTGVFLLCVSAILLTGYLAFAVLVDCRHPPARQGVAMQDVCLVLGVKAVRQ